MKALSLICLLTVFSVHAHASFFQENCSNAAGTLQVRSGHNENFNQALKREWTGSEYKETVVDLNPSEIEMTSTDEQEIAEKKLGGCQPGAEHGWAGGINTWVKKVRYVKTDGSAFDEHFVDRTQDGLALEAYLICELEWNNLIICED